MNYEVKVVDQIVRHLSVIIDEPTYKADYEKAFAKYARQVQIDGFRKGKAPRSVIERLYTNQVKASYLEEYADVYYKQGLQLSGLSPMSQADILDVDFHEDGSVVFIYEFEVMPEDFTYEYEGLEVPFKAEEYNEVRLENTIDDLLDENAEEVPFDENSLVEFGDKLTLQNTATQETLEPIFIDSFTAPEVGIEYEAILGKKLNDTIEYTFEEANEKGEYKIIDAFKVVPPPLNDETAQVLGHENVEKMKEALKETILNELEESNNKKFNNELIIAFGKRNIENLKIPKQYMLGVGKSILWNNIGRQYGEEFVEKLPEEIILKVAENQTPAIIWDLVYEQIAKDHDIQVTPEEVEAELTKIAAQFTLSVEEFKQKYSNNLESIEESLLAQKVLRFIKPLCKVIDPPAEPEKVYDEDDYHIVDTVDHENIETKDQT